MRPGRRLLRIGLEVAAAAMGLFALAVVALAWRLSTGPIVLDYLTPRIVAALSPPESGVTVSIGRTELAWAGWEHALDLRATEVRAVNPDGRVLATVPEIRIGFSGRALLRGIVAPSRLGVVSPTLLLSRGADGQVSFGLLPAEGIQGVPARQGRVEGAAGAGAVGIPLHPAPASGESDTDAVLDALLEALASPPDLSQASGYLTSISVLGGRLLLNDAPSGLIWSVPSLDLMLQRDPAGLRATAAGAIEQAAGRTYVSASAWLDRHSETVRGTLSVSGLRPSQLAPAAIDRSGDTMAALAGLDLALSGSIAFRSAADGTQAALDFALRAESGRLVPPGLEGSYPVRFAELRGRLSDGLETLVLDELRLDLDGPTLEFSGTASNLLRSPVGEATAVVRNMPLDRLPGLWPPTLGPNPRAWVLGNLSDGRIEEARATVAFQVADGRVAATDLLGGLTFGGVTVDYFAPLPPVSGVDGIATFDDASFNIDILGGTIRQTDIGGGATGPVAVPSGRIDITGLDGRDHRIAISLEANGPLGSMLEVVDHPALGYASEIGLDPATVSGTASSQLDFRFPLIDDLMLGQVEIGVAGTLAGTAVRDVVGGLDLTDGELALDLDKDGMLVEGTGALAGLPLTLSWRERFGEHRPQRELAASGTLEAQDLGRFGFDLAPAVDGPLAITVRGEGSAQRLDLALSADLTQAVLDLPDIALGKPAGSAGTFDVTLALLDGEPFGDAHAAIRADDLVAEIPLRFAAPSGNADGGVGLDRIGPAALRFGRNDLRVTATPLPDIGWDVGVTGASLDLEPLLRREAMVGETESGDDPGEPGEAGPAGPGPNGAGFNASFDVDTVWVGDSTALSRLTGSIGRRQGRWFFADLTGLAPGGAGLALRLVPDESERRLSLTAQDTGALLRTLELHDGIRGGTLWFEGVFDDERPGSPMTGELVISDYRVLDLPLLARLLNIASLTGPGELLAGDGIAFHRAEASLELDGDSLSITDGRAFGDGLGLTVEGVLDLEADTIDASGTLVPAYALNAALGHIPILGPLLTGQPGSGVFAATYTLRGPLAEPGISVNPIAALAPGFLRNLFGMFGEARDRGPQDPRFRGPEHPGWDPPFGQ